MSGREAERGKEPLSALTRRFATREEIQTELKNNLLSGSLWVPRGPGEEEIPARAQVEVMLVLPDGRVIDGIRGRVFCIAPGGVAIFVEDLPVDALTLLSAETHLEEEVRTPPAARPREELRPPVGGRQMEELRAPVFDPEPMEQPDPFAAAEVPAITAPEPFSSGESVEPEIFAPEDAPQFVAATPPPPPATPRTVSSEGGPRIARSLGRGEERPVIHVTPTPRPLLPATPAVPVPVAPRASPDAPETSAVNRVLLDQLAAESDGADFPVIRPADFNPVPSMMSGTGLWDESDESALTYPALKETAVSAPDPLVVEFEDAASLRLAYLGDLGMGRLFVVTATTRPPVDTRVEVTLILPAGSGGLLLGAVVAYHMPEGVGLKLDPLDSTTRALIEAGFQGPGAFAKPSAAPEPAPAAAVATPVPAPALGQSAGPDIAAHSRTEPAKVPELVFPFATLVDFRREYETNIRRGGVLVPAAQVPPIRSPVEVVFSLMNGKREVRLRGEVVFHAPTGAGVQLADIPPAVRREVEALLAAASVSPDSANRTVAPPKPAPKPVGPPPESPLRSPAASVAAASDKVKSGMAVALTAASAGSRFEGDLVEVLREAEVEGEARIEGQVGGRASWLKVLANLQSQGATGVVTASRKGESKTFLVFQGRIVDAQAQPARDDESIVRIVKKQNLLKMASIKVLERAVKSIPDEVEAMNSAQIWTPAEIDKARRWQILERCSDVFGWEKGRYSFEPDGDRRWARPTTGVPIGHVVLHGVRSYIRASGEDLARIMRAAMDRIVAVVPGTGFEPMRVGMSDKELRFWADIDGTKTVRQVLAISPVATSQAHRLLFALCRLGVLAIQGSPPPAANAGREDRAELLRTKLADMKARDPFARLGVSWMAAPTHVQMGWLSFRKDVEPDLKYAPEISSVAKELLALGEETFKLLMDDRTRRLARLKVIEDPSRIEAAADMLAEKANILHLRGDRPGALSAIQMALDLCPSNAIFEALAGRLLA